MLQIVLPEREFFDEETSTFVYLKKEIIQLEHSLVSISKWESKWCKPFLSKEDKTPEETIDYIRQMTITQNVSPLVYDYLSNEVITQIQEYVNAKMSATWFNDKQQGPGTHSREIITSEVIYYWMIAQNIPFECQKWHLNRLLTLIRVCSIKNQPAKKPGKKESLKSRGALNAARRAQHNTRG